jgi:hypothetical protein
MTATARPLACRRVTQPRDRDGEPRIKHLLRILADVLARRRRPGIEEQYLAQAVDAQDLQVRLLVLERARP